ncbi:hypothetical protein B0H14DRAFT_3488760 [Mycena olivaceomarginata]|nr:hypothetical protein B0H14DRAFT_3488760 [Mycena olivaceomarginata]
MPIIRSGDDQLRKHSAQHSPSSLWHIRLWPHVQPFMHPSKAGDIPYLISGFSTAQPPGDRLAVVDRCAEHVPSSKLGVHCLFVLHLELPVVLPTGARYLPLTTTWRYYRPAASRATVCAACHLSTAHCYPLPAGSAPAAPMHAAACEHIHHLTIPSRGALALSKRCPSAHPLSCPAAVYLGRLLTATLTLVGSWM